MLVKTEELSNCKGSREKKLIWFMLLFFIRIGEIPQYAKFQRNRERRKSPRISDRADNVAGMRSRSLIRINFIGEIIIRSAVEQRERSRSAISL